MRTLSTRELAQRVAQELSAPQPEVQAILDRAVEVIKGELQRGNRVEFPEFLALSVRSGTPLLTKTQSEAVLNLPAARLLQMEVNEELRRRIEGTALYRILLVAEHRHFFTNVIASRLTTPRTELSIVEGAEQAWTLLKEQPADLVLLDGGLKDGPALCERIKRRRQSSLSGVIRIFAEGQDPGKIEELEVLPDGVLREPFEMSDLVALAESELARTVEERNYFEHLMRFKLHTGDALLARAGELLTDVLGQSRLGEESQEKLLVAFREGMDNAARHGNRYDAQRLIEVQYLADQERATVTVEDQGEGFDPEPYLRRSLDLVPLELSRERAANGQSGGLGILLMRKCADRVEYNATGNKVTLSKLIGSSRAALPSEPAAG
jgi:anti-sigma regulatory factor (Ser/Thr protein kinase)/nucleoid DNA-binding protein